MSERDEYPTGVPCWVDTMQPDAEAAARFYGALFGWELAGPAATGDPPGSYFVARVRGGDVAGIGSPPPAHQRPPTVWNTYVAVESADAAAEAARGAGGTVLAEPFDVPPAGRLGVVADPAGAAFGVWEAGEREGAQRVNEPGAWSMSLLATSDPEGAKAFYGAVFGWETEGFELDGAQFWLWRLPGYVGGEPAQPVPRDLVAVMAPLGADPPAGASPSWSVDFWVDDVDATATRVAELGGAVVVEPASTPIARQATLADPEGATFTVSRVTAGG
jgi:predicted enzyme related to lactoylglutathione lyase